MGRSPSGIWHSAFVIAVFVILATANSAGYRYGASDEAFYIPAVLRHLDPRLFPRDRVLIDSQARLTAVDEALAAAARVTGATLPHLFLPLYVLTLLSLAGALIRIGQRLYASRWTTTALLAALTLRHAIARTGANTLEPYFHPRQLAFALGLWAVVMALEARFAWVVALLVVAGVIHPTTTVWFVVWIAVALMWQHPTWRRRAVAGLVLAGAAGALLVWRGPLAGHLVRMDAAWLAVIAEKDYLFPLQWPWRVWLTNLIAIPIVVLGWRARIKAGTLVPGETAIVAGLLSLVVLFLLWLPFNAARVALAVQLQLSRVFWMLDVWGTVYLIWWLAEGSSSSTVSGGSRRAGSTGSVRSLVLACGLIAASLARGGYTMFEEFPHRALFAVNIANKDWLEAMAWAQSTDPRSGWLADPAHAARYGVSLRAAAGRDVLIEALKDTAIAMYDRDIAMRVADRERALEQHPWNTADGARSLAASYDLDYLVTESQLPLPLAHTAGPLFIYRIR
jgi:hypothetical protein